MGVTKLQADQLNVTAGGGVDCKTTRVIITDFISNSIDNGWNVRNSGTGSGVAFGATPRDGIVGLANASTGTDSNGFAGVSTTDNTTQVSPVDGDFMLLGKFITPAALSDGTNRYTIQGGLNESNAGLGADHLIWYYSDNVNSGKLQVIMSTGGVNSATIDTGITIAADTVYNVAIVVTGVGQNIEVFVNGTSVGTATPSATFGSGNRVSPIFTIAKSLGTTSRTLGIDRFGIIFAA
jgi:hypothetical protein